MQVRPDLGRIEKWVLRNAFDDEQKPYLPKVGVIVTFCTGLSILVLKSLLSKTSIFKILHFPWMAVSVGKLFIRIFFSIVEKSLFWL